MSFLAPRHEDYLRLRNKLIELGYGLGGVTNRFQIEEQTQMNANIVWQFDPLIRRCIAKIAFNYLAWIADERADFLLRPEFDLLRSYIRFGDLEELGNSLVSLAGVPNLGFVEPNPIGDCHWAAATWEPTGALTSYLSIFGVLTYRVVLCQRYGGVWFDISDAHYFNVPEKRIQRFRVSCSIELVLT